MRESIGGSFLFLRSREGGGAYESDLSELKSMVEFYKKDLIPKYDIPEL